MQKEQQLSIQYICEQVNQHSQKPYVHIKHNDRNEQDFISLQNMQKILKDQFLLLSSQQQQKNIFEKKLNSTLLSYYKSTVQLGESKSEKRNQNTRLEQSRGQFLAKQKDREKKKGQTIYEQQKRLFEEEGFENSYTFIKEIMLSLSKDPRIMMVLIAKYENSSRMESLSSIAKIIMGSMFQNIVDDDVYNKDILKIIAFIWRNIVKDKKHYFDINFLEESFSKLILSELIERSQMKNYSKQISKNTLLEIIKLDHLIQYKAADFEDEKSSLKSVSISMSHKDSKQSKEKQGSMSSRSLESPIKIGSYFLKASQKKSKMKLYSEGLRIQDEKLRKGYYVKRKNRNCISDELLKKLGITEEINFPSFYCTNVSEQTRKEQQINRHLGILLAKAQSRQQMLNYPDVSIVKNIILTFFNDVFKMLYSMPPLMRIICKMLYQYLSLSFNNKNCLSVVADFVINFWFTSALRIDVSLIEAGKLGNYTQKNLDEILKIIKAIVKDNYKQINNVFSQQFNILVTNLKISITNYIYEIVNISSDKITKICQELEILLSGKNQIKESKENQTGEKQNKICSYCVCISNADIKKIMEMLKDAEKEINEINDKILKRIRRIQQMNSEKDIFGDRKDKITGKMYKPQKAYVLFTQLQLPKHLSIDYQKQYVNAFKNQKAKNLMRQVLLSLDCVTSYSHFYNCLTLNEFFMELEVLSEDDNLFAIDKIPLYIKIQYLNILIKSENVQSILQNLKLQTISRFDFFKQTQEKSKECYLKAIASINFQNEKLRIKQSSIRNQIKKKKLEEFIAKNQIKLCLTSPKTREKQIVLKTSLMKDLTQEYKEKLWLQNQFRCIHTALNLDFIKSLTGEPEKTKSKYESHFSNIMRFSQILCSLPEVKERFNVVEDTLGIKEVFFDFIKFCREFIQSKEQQYYILLENIEWLEENIQQKISKRLYEKLYPKMPLYDDIAFYLRVKTLDWLNFEHFKIEEEMRQWALWDVAATHLRLIDKLRTAGQKLNCIEQTSRIIVNSYLLMSKKERSVTADDIYPLFVLVLIRAAPKRLISSVSFIESFASPTKLLSKEGYCFTQLKAAIQFCDTLSAENIQICEDEATNHIEFNRKMYEKQIQYGIYFMLGKKRSSPNSQRKKLQYLRKYFKKEQKIEENAEHPK